LPSHLSLRSPLQKQFQRKADAPLPRHAEQIAAMQVMHAAQRGLRLAESKYVARPEPAAVRPDVVSQDWFAVADAALLVSPLV